MYKKYFFEERIFTAKVLKIIAKKKKCYVLYTINDLVIYILAKKFRDSNGLPKLLNDFFSVNVKKLYIYRKKKYNKKKK